jgi:DNA-binding PadR family transcriptional regulator
MADSHAADSPPSDSVPSDAPVRLTPTSFIVLGLVSRAGEATPYDLKQGVAASVGNFWSLPHAQLYAEPARLARAGLLEEEREAGGRRRKTYRITDAGRAALGAWLAEPTGTSTELRDPGLLKLFFGAEREPLARAQLEAHQAKLTEYEELMEALGSTLDEGARLSLTSGIGHEREWVRFWSRIAEGELRVNR